MVEVDDRGSIRSNELNSCSLDEFNFEELKFAHGQLVALENATRAQSVRFVGEMMKRNEWHRDTSGGFERWLCQQFQWSRKLSLEVVAVATRMAELPLIIERFASGALSWEQTVAVCEFATSEDEAVIVQQVETMTLDQCRLLARSHRLKNVEEHPERKRKSFMGWNRNHDTFKLNARFDASLGAVVENAFNHAMDVFHTNSRLQELSYSERLTHAIADVCATNLHHGMESPRPIMVVHVDAAVLAGVKDGLAEIENGPTIDHKVARRIACDSKVQLVFDGTDGKPVGIGRTSRRVPHWLARQLNKRDGGCRFPGCGSRNFLHFHHIDEWIRNKGHTDMDRMVTLCARHHHFFHEAEWRIRGGPDDFQFVDKSGNVFDGRRPNITRETQRKFVELVAPLFDGGFDDGGFVVRGTKDCDVNDGKLVDGKSSGSKPSDSKPSDSKSNHNEPAERSNEDVGKPGDA